MVEKPCSTILTTTAARPWRLNPIPSLLLSRPSDTPKVIIVNTRQSTRSFCLWKNRHAPSRLHTSIEGASISSSSRGRQWWPGWASISQLVSTRHLALTLGDTSWSWRITHAPTVRKDLSLSCPGTKTPLKKCPPLRYALILERKR